jgi:hypothetical protein
VPYLGRNKRIGSLTEQQAWNMIGLAIFSAAIYYCGSGDPTMFVCPAALVAWIMVCNHAHRKYGYPENRRTREGRRGRR